MQKSSTILIKGLSLYYILSYASFLSLVGTLGKIVIEKSLQIHPAYIIPQMGQN